MVQIDPFGSFAQGVSLRNNMSQQRANVQAAQGLASGNYAQALGALGGVGDIANVLKVQEAQVDNQKAARETQAADTARQIAFTRQAARSVRSALQEGQDPLTTFDSLAPALQSMGSTPEQISAFRQSLAQNPTGFLDQVDAIANNAQRQLEIQNLGNGYGVAIDKATGQVVNEYQAPQRPMNVGNVLIDPSTREVILDAREPKYQTIQNTDGSSSVVAIDQPEVTTAPRGGSDVDVLGAIESVIPGVTFNSGLRTPEQNRGAGGAGRSYHLRGQAVDIPPQQGTTPEQLKAQLRAQGVDVRELLNEGDHWHIAWGNDQKAPNFGRGETRQAGTRVVAQGENRGLSPVQQRSEDRDQRVQDRQYRQDSRQLRRDFEGQPDVKNYEEVRSAYNRLQALTRSGSATDDTAVGFEFMKMLDPTSVVRESEYALVGQSQGIGGQALVALQRLSTGQRLTPELRRNLVDTAGRVFQGRQARYNELVQQYRGYAQEDGFDPNRVVPLRNGDQQNDGRQRPQTNAPGIPFNLAGPQLATRQRLVQQGATSRAAVGSTQNPRYVNPQQERQSLMNIRPNEWFVTPSGEMLRMPDPNPYRRR